MIYFADLEAYSLKYFVLNNKVKSYAHILKSADKKTLIFDVDCKNWINKILELKKDMTIYFHNGGNYDLHFIIPVIEKMGLEYDYFINQQKSVYQLTIKNKLNKIKFLDTYKIIPTSLKAMGDIIGLPKLDYGDYDITKEYPTNESYIDDFGGKLYEYLNRDVDIMIAFFDNLKEGGYDIEKMKMTIASESYDTWKRTNPYIYQKIRNGYHRGHKNGTNLRYDTNQWLTLKKGYRGGFTYVNPKHQLKEIKNIYKYDVNSLYPSAMRNNLFPAGKIFEGDKTEASFKFYYVDIKYAKAKFVPFIEALKGEPNHEYQYPYEISEVSKYMSNTLLECFEKYYEGEWTKKVIFSIYEYKNVFTKFVDDSNTKKIEAEKNNNNLLRTWHKLIMNSEYGKNGQKINDLTSQITTDTSMFTKKEKATWFISENGQRSKVTKNEDIYYYTENNGFIEEHRFNYLPLAIKITELARVQLVDAIVKNWDNFIYCDTDSIHLLKPAKNISINDYELGKWKYEGMTHTGIYRRSKHYMSLGLTFKDKVDNDFYQIKGGGFNVNLINSEKSITKELYLNTRFIIENGKKTRSIVDGGVIIYTKDYEFKMPHWYENK